jgi:hypothetical protein
LPTKAGVPTRRVSNQDRLEASRVPRLVLPDENKKLVRRLKVPSQANKENRQRLAIKDREVNLRNVLGICWSVCIKRFVVPLNRVIDFTAMNWHFARSFHAEAYLVSTDFHHNDFDIVIDDDAFVLLSREYQHGSFLFAAACLLVTTA